MPCLLIFYRLAIHSTLKMGNNKRILIVDDEESIREGLQTYLQFEGYDAESVSSAEEALRKNIPSYNLILLDIMMDKMSGTELANHLKSNEQTKDIPIIFITAKDQNDEMVEGLRLGADDYIVKPFYIKNVLARIEAVLRRYSNNLNNHDINFIKRKDAGVEYDRNKLLCIVDGKEIKLPKKEFELLALFLENKGRIFTREEIMQKVWPDNVIIADRSIDVHITKLRNKIAPYGKYIISRSGYGYGWQD